MRFDSLEVFKGAIPYFQGTRQLYALESLAKIVAYKDPNNQQENVIDVDYLTSLSTMKTSFQLHVTRILTHTHSKIGGFQFQIQRRNQSPMLLLLILMGYYDFYSNYLI